MKSSAARSNKFGDLVTHKCSAGSSMPKASRRCMSSIMTLPQSLFCVSLRWMNTGSPPWPERPLHCSSKKALVLVPFSAEHRSRPSVLLCRKKPEPRLAPPLRLKTMLSILSGNTNTGEVAVPTPLSLPTTRYLAPSVPFTPGWRQSPEIEPTRQTPASPVQCQPSGQDHSALRSNERGKLTSRKVGMTHSKWSSLECSTPRHSGGAPATPLWQHALPLPHHSQNPALAQ
mmetsp:Transcript_99973/g.278423  ORF Transcript_99973/g.278423 Transcript_99973/m.278423 type:complete len:230 (-) Transcript_99973:1647-2336(-)